MSLEPNNLLFNPKFLLSFQRRSKMKIQLLALTGLLASALVACPSTDVTKQSVMTVALTPENITIKPGESKTITVALTPNATAQLSASSDLAGVTTKVNGKTIKLTANANAEPGDGAVTVTARVGSNATCSATDRPKSALEQPRKWIDRRIQNQPGPRTEI
jgi:hypothetical protein